MYNDGVVGPGVGVGWAWGGGGGWGGVGEWRSKVKSPVPYHAMQPYSNNKTRESGISFISKYANIVLEECVCGVGRNHPYVNAHVEVPTGHALITGE